MNGRMCVCCGECYVVSNECEEPTSCLVQLTGAYCCEVMYFGCFGFRGELDFLNCEDICMCIVNKLWPGSGRVCGVKSVFFCESGLFVLIAGPGICILY